MRLNVLICWLPVVLQADDVVHSVNGKSVAGRDQDSVCKALQAGDAVSVRVMRAVETDSDSYFDDENFAEAQEFDQIDFTVQVGAQGYSAEEVRKLRAAAAGDFSVDVESY